MTISTAIPIRTQEEALELVRKMALYYTENPDCRRAIEERGLIWRNRVPCFRTFDNRRSPIGRCLVNSRGVQREFDGWRFNAVVREINTAPGHEALAKGRGQKLHEYLFRERYRGFPVGLWMRLQRLHDEDQF